MTKMKQNRQGLITVIVILVLFGAFGNYLRFAERRSSELPRLGEIPLVTENYIGEEQRFDEESYEVLRADTTTLRLYVDPDGNKYWLFIAYFASQKYGSQIHSPRHCLPGGGWKIENIEPFEITFADNSSKLVNRLLINVDQHRQLMLYWFETRGGAIRDEFGLKFDLMKNSLLLRPTDAAIVRLTVPLNVGEDFDSATKRALDCLDTFHPTIMKSLPF